LNPYQEIEQKVTRARTLDELAATLEILLSGGYGVWTDGSLYDIRQLVERVNGLKIEVFAKEHAPPHFHVRGGDVDATFTIADGTLMTGTINGTQLRLVRWWYERSRNSLIEIWNATRPADCPVGPIQLGES
jgi:hypothetical protein